MENPRETLVHNAILGGVGWFALTIGQLYAIATGQTGAAFLLTVVVLFWVPACAVMTYIETRRAWEGVEPSENDVQAPMRAILTLVAMTLFAFGVVIYLVPYVMASS